jgi:chorismate--pyruvate lyase
MYINGQPIFVAETIDPFFLRDWIEHQYSLTDKFNAAKGSSHLEVISQNWIAPTWWDTYLLNIDDKLIFQREILMKHQGVDYWYARTIIPQKCYNSNPDFFKRLEKESIRNLIFDNNTVHRINMINYPVNHQCIEFNWVKKYLNSTSDILWVRLAEYSFQGLESFFLVEILLPELENIL